MDCAGVCLNGYTGGDYGSTLNTYYLDSDGDGWGVIDSSSAESLNESVVELCNAGSESPDSIKFIDPTYPDYVSNHLDFNDDINCLSNIIDCSGDCLDNGISSWGTNTFKNEDNECVFVVFPGDVNMDGKASTEDIVAIVNNWGEVVLPRSNVNDVDGNKIRSEYSWSPQYINRNYVSNPCLYGSDANGDGSIGIADVMAVILNSSKTSHSYVQNFDCSTVARSEDLSRYFDIYRSLPAGELRSAFSEKFNFAPLPDKFQIMNNYPNPFNPTTTIQYSVPLKGLINTKIINLNGQVVENQFIERDVGNYEHNWDANNFPSGIYFFQIIHNNQIQATQKMVYLK